MSKAISEARRKSFEANQAKGIKKSKEVIFPWIFGKDQNKTIGFKLFRLNDVRCHVYFCYCCETETLFEYQNLSQYPLRCTVCSTDINPDDMGIINNAYKIFSAMKKEEIDYENSDTY